MFLAALWILISISSYSWLVTILKISLDIKLQQSIKQNIDYKVEKNTIYWKDISWTKPILWDWENFLFWDKFIMGHEIIFQLQPIQPVKLLHTPKQKRIGWIASLELPPEQIFNFIASYLINQRNLIWAKILNHDEPQKIQKNISQKREKNKQNEKFSVYRQRYLFFDLYQKKRSDSSLYSCFT